MHIITLWKEYWEEVSFHTLVVLMRMCVRSIEHFMACLMYPLIFIIHSAIIFLLWVIDFESVQYTGINFFSVTVPVIAVVWYLIFYAWLLFLVRPSLTNLRDYRTFLLFLRSIVYIVGIALMLFGCTYLVTYIMSYFHVFTVFKILPRILTLLVHIVTTILCGVMSMVLSFLLDSNRYGIPKVIHAFRMGLRLFLYTLPLFLMYTLFVALIMNIMFLCAGILSIGIQKIIPMSFLWMIDPIWFFMRVLVLYPVFSCLWGTYYVNMVYGKSFLYVIVE